MPSASILWTGNANDKLFHQQGFTSTVIDSLSLGAVSTQPSDVTNDGTANPIVVDSTAAANKVTQLVGFSTTILQTITLPTAVIASGKTGPTGCTWDGLDLLVVGTSAVPSHDAIFKLVNFTTTIRDSVACSEASGLSWTGADVIYSRFDTTLAIYRLMQAVGFSGTVQTSVNVSSIDTAPNDISWNGTNPIWCGSQADKLYEQSGFTSTLNTSLSVAAKDADPLGIEHGSYVERNPITDTDGPYWVGSAGSAC